jgi:Tfp pilus assembly protein PilF
MMMGNNSQHKTTTNYCIIILDHVYSSDALAITTHQKLYSGIYSVINDVNRHIHLDNNTPANIVPTNATSASSSSSRSSSSSSSGSSINRDGGNDNNSYSNSKTIINLIVISENQIELSNQHLSSLVKMDNTVIEPLSIEDSRKLLKFWKISDNQIIEKIISRSKYVDDGRSSSSSSSSSSSNDKNSKYLPGELIKYTLINNPSTYLSSVSSTTSPSSISSSSSTTSTESKLNIDEIYNFMLTDTDKRLLLCLFPSLRSGYLFDSQLSWYLSSEFIDTIEMMNESIDRLIKLQWMKHISDNNYYFTYHCSSDIYDNIVKRSRLSLSLLIDKQKQSDKYYNYYLYIIKMLNSLIINKDIQQACMKYDYHHHHIELIIIILQSNNSASTSTTAANNRYQLLSPTDKDNIILSILDNIDIISKYRLSTKSIRTDLSSLYHDGLKIILKNHGDDHIVTVYYKMKMNIFLISLNSSSASTSSTVIHNNHQQLDDNNIKATQDQYEHSLQILLLRNNRNDEHMDISPFLIEYSFFLYNHGKFTQGLEYLNQALNIRKSMIQQNSRHSSSYSSVNNNNTIGDNNNINDNIDKSIRSSSISGISSSNDGSSNISIAEVIYYIANFQRELFDNENALLNYHEAIRIYTLYKGEYHGMIAMILIDISKLHENYGDNNDAISTYQQSLSILLKQYTSNDIVIINIISKLTKLIQNCSRDLFQLNKDNEAYIYYQKIITIYKNIYSKQNSLYVAKLLYDLGSECNDLDKNDIALNLLQESLSIRQKVYMNINNNHSNHHHNNHNNHDNSNSSSYDHIDIANSLNNIGLVLDDLNDKEKSLQYYEKALLMYTNLYGEEHVTISRTLYNIASVKRSMGSTKDALAIFKKSLRISTTIYGDTHSDTLDLKAAIAELSIQEKY